MPAAPSAAWGGAGGSCQLPPTSPALRSSAVLTPAPPQPIFPPVAPGGGGRAMQLPCMQICCDIRQGHPQPRHVACMAVGGEETASRLSHPHCPTTCQHLPLQHRRQPPRSQRALSPPTERVRPPRYCRLSGRSCSGWALHQRPHPPSSSPEICSTCRHPPPRTEIPAAPAWESRPPSASGAVPADGGPRGSRQLPHAAHAAAPQQMQAPPAGAADLPTRCAPAAAGGRCTCPVDPPAAVAACPA